MPLGQGWLNAWVKVNSKHVVFPANNKGDRDNQDPNQNLASKSQNAKASGANSSVVTATTTVSGDAETQAIKRFNNRKHKRRLHRTISASDLIRDKAKGKGDKSSSTDSEAALDKSSSSQATIGRKGASNPSQRDTKLKATVHVPQHEEHSIQALETGGSLGFVAGFFGTHIESLEAPAATPCFNQINYDSASVQVAPQDDLDAASIVSRGGHSLPARPYQSGSSLPKTEANDSASKGGGFRFPPNLFAGDNNSKGHCRQCSKLENELISSREDLEYLREMAIRSESICATCQTEPSKRLDRLAQTSSELSAEAQMLNEVTARHKAQIEQLSKERQRWQHDSHVKLQKFASLCKDLNEEAALRNEEALALHKELDCVRGERDQTATELEKARATIAQHERNEVERNKSELMIRQYEQKGLDGADRAIKTRDSIITDLAGRLERSLDCLEFEREQQRQRRKIIFPAQRASQSQDGCNGEELEADLRNTKDLLRESQSSMDSLQRDAARKELEMRVRMENLERQLEAARSQSG